MFVRTMQHKIWPLIPTTIKLHSFLLACSCAGKTFYLSEAEQPIFNDVANDIRAARFHKKKRPPNATSLYTKDGELIYWIHPRDAFLIKLVYLNDCYRSKTVGPPLTFWYTAPSRGKLTHVFFSKQPSLEYARDVLAHLPRWLDADDEECKGGLSHGQQAEKYQGNGHNTGRKTPPRKKKRIE